MHEYVDRGKLLKDIEDSVRFTAKSGQPSLEIRGANKITARIMAAPAADVVEVRHGKYIQASKRAQIGLKCSICGARIKYSEHFNGNRHYCYKCGTKMDGKGEGE